mmetsp:Transcript_29425/g.70539  ORF Transcript_29425/g.70539 Transcript_29425/m.70539 type:complete len:237 (+) Transcript_29425:2082-2792(+)
MAILVVQSQRMGDHVHCKFPAGSPNTNLRVSIPLNRMVRHMQTLYDHGAVYAPWFCVRGSGQSKTPSCKCGHKDTDVWRMQPQPSFDNTHTVNREHHQRRSRYLNLQFTAALHHKACVLQRIASYCTLLPPRWYIQDSVHELTQNHNSGPTPESHHMVPQSLQLGNFVNVGFTQSRQHPLPCRNRLGRPFIELCVLAEPMPPQWRAGRRPTEWGSLHALLCSVIRDWNSGQKQCCY